MYHRIPLSGISRGLVQYSSSSSSSSSSSFLSSSCLSYPSVSCGGSVVSSNRLTETYNSRFINQDNYSVRKHSTISSIASTKVSSSSDTNSPEEQSSLLTRISSSSLPSSKSSNFSSSVVIPPVESKDPSSNLSSSSVSASLPSSTTSRNRQRTSSPVQERGNRSGTRSSLSSSNNNSNNNNLPEESSSSSYSSYTLNQRSTNSSSNNNHANSSLVSLSALEAEVQSLYHSKTGKVPLSTANNNNSNGNNHYDTSRQLLQLWGMYQRHPEVSYGGGTTPTSVSSTSSVFSGTSNSPSLNSSFFAAAISSYIHRGAFRLAIELYLSRANHSGTTGSSPYSVIHSVSSSPPHASLSSQTRTPSYVVDRRTYSLLIKAASRIGNPDILEKILEDAVWYGNIDEKVYLDRLLTTCLQVPVPDIARALGILKRMFLLGSRLTHNVYRQVTKYAFSTKQSERMVYALRELVYKRKQLELQQSIADLDTNEVQQTLQDLETRMDPEEFDNENQRSFSSTTYIENQLRRLSLDASHLQKLTNTELKEALPFDTEQLALPILQFCLENANGSTATVAYYSYRTLLLSSFNTLSTPLHFTSEIQKLYTSILYHGGRTGTPTLIEIALVDIMFYFRQMELVALTSNASLNSNKDNNNDTINPIPNNPSVNAILDQRKVWLNDCLHALLVAYATTGDSVGAMRTLCLIIHEGFTLRSAAWDATIRCLQKASSNFHQWEQILRSSSEQQQQQQQQQSTSSLTTEESASVTPENIDEAHTNLPEQSSENSVAMNTDEALSTDQNNAELSSSNSESEDGGLSSSSAGLNDNDFSGNESNRSSDGDSSDTSGDDGMVSSLSSGSFHRSVSASTIAFLNQRPSASSYVLPSSKSEYALLASLLGTYPQMFNGELPNNFPIEDTHISLPFPTQESAQKLFALQNLATLNAPPSAPRNNDGTISAEALRTERPEALAALAAGYGAASYLGRLSFLGIAEAHALTTSNGGWLNVLQSVTEQLDSYIFSTNTDSNNGENSNVNYGNPLDLSQISKYSLSSVLSQQHGGVAVQLPEGNFRMFATISQTLGLPANTYGAEQARLARTEGRFPTIPPTALAACISSFVMNRGTRRQALVLAEFAFRALEVTPDADVYAAILSNYSHERRDKVDLTTAQEIVRKMVSNGITPNARMYTELVTLWLRAKRINKAYDTLVQSIQVNAAPSLEMFELTARAAMKMITGKSRKDKQGRTDNSNHESIAEISPINKDSNNSSTNRTEDDDNANLVSPITILDLAERAGYKVSERLREILLLELNPEHRYSSSTSKSLGTVSSNTGSRQGSYSSRDRSLSDRYTNNKTDRSSSKTNRSKSLTKILNEKVADNASKSSNDSVAAGETSSEKKTLPKAMKEETATSIDATNISLEYTVEETKRSDSHGRTKNESIKGVNPSLSVSRSVNTLKPLESGSQASEFGTESDTGATVPKSFLQSSLPASDETASDPAARLRAFAAVTFRTSPNPISNGKLKNPTVIISSESSNLNGKLGTNKTVVSPKKVVVLPKVPPVTENYEPVSSLLDKTVNNMVNNMENTVQQSVPTKETNVYNNHPLSSTVIGTVSQSLSSNK